jgi:CRP-like cAMP-binding protein
VNAEPPATRSPEPRSRVVEPTLDPGEIRLARPFRLVADHDLDQLAREVVLIDVVAGTTLFEQGDPAGGVATIIAGEVEISQDGRRLAVLGYGAVFGELSLFVSSASRTATAVATSDVRMLAWQAGDVADRLARRESLATAIVADLASVLAERLERRTQDVVALIQAVGTRLPVSELERYRSRMVE